jgi:hypothetical protein
VRRELAINFVHYTPDYDRYRCLPAWAKKTLDEHAADQREQIYDLKALAGGRNPRSILECRYGGDARHRFHAQLHAHVLGKENPGVVAISRNKPLIRPC